MSVTRVTNDNIVSFEGSKMIGTIGAECMPAVLPAVSAINLTNLPALGDLGYQNITNWQDGAVQTISLNLNADAISKVLVKVWQEYPDNDKTNGDWDITTNDSGFDLTSSAYAQTLTPAAITGSSVTFTMGGGTFAATDLGKVIMNMSAGETGQARIISIAANVATCKITTDFTNTDAIASGDWTMFAGEFTGGSFAISNATVSGGFCGSKFHAVDSRQAQNCWSIMLSDTHGIIISQWNPDSNARCYSFGINNNDPNDVTFSSSYLSLASNGEHYLGNMDVVRVDDTRCLYHHRHHNQNTSYYRVITSTSGSATPTAGSEYNNTHNFDRTLCIKKLSVDDGTQIYFNATWSGPSSAGYPMHTQMLRVQNNNQIQFGSSNNNITDSANNGGQEWKWDTLEFDVGTMNDFQQAKLVVLQGTGSNGNTYLNQWKVTNGGLTMDTTSISRIALGPLGIYPSHVGGIVQVSDTLGFLIYRNEATYMTDNRTYYVSISSDGTDVTVGTPTLLGPWETWAKGRCVYDGTNIILYTSGYVLAGLVDDPRDESTSGAKVITFDVDHAAKTISTKDVDESHTMWAVGSTDNLRLSVTPTTGLVLASHYGKNSQPGFSFRLSNQAISVFPYEDSFGWEHIRESTSTIESYRNSAIAHFSGDEYMSAYIESNNNNLIKCNLRYFKRGSIPESFDWNEINNPGDMTAFDPSVPYGSGSNYMDNYREVVCAGVSATKAILLGLNSSSANGTIIAVPVNTTNTQTKESTLSFGTDQYIYGIGSSGGGLAICKIDENLAFYAFHDYDYKGMVGVLRISGDGLQNSIHEHPSSDSVYNWTNDPAYSANYSGGTADYSSVAALSSSKLLVTAVNSNGNLRMQAFSYTPGGTYNVNTGEQVNGLKQIGNDSAVDVFAFQGGIGSTHSSISRIDDTTAIVAANAGAPNGVVQAGKIVVVDCSAETLVVGTSADFGVNKNPINVHINMFDATSGILNYIDHNSSSPTYKNEFYAYVTVSGGVPSIGTEYTVLEPGCTNASLSSTISDTGMVATFKKVTNFEWSNGRAVTTSAKKLSAPLYVANQYVTAITGTDSIDTTNYADLNSMTVTETLNGGTANYAFAIDSTPTASTVTGGTFFVIGLGETTTRNIASSLSSVHGGVDGTWYINNDATYGSTTWVAAATNETKEAIAEATAVTNNQMSGTTVNAVTDTSWPALGTQLSVAITLHSASDSSSPSVDGISLNYDGNVINRDMTESYTVEMLNNSSVRITAPSSGGPRNARVYITS